MPLLILFDQPMKLRYLGTHGPARFFFWPDHVANVFDWDGNLFNRG